jgi:cyclic-di-AMP phosphodiesterase
MRINFGRRQDMDNKYNYFTPSNKVYMVIIALLIMILFIYGHDTEGFIVLGIYAVLMIYNIRSLQIKKNEWRKFIEDFSTKLDTATRSTLVNLPFPLMIIGNQGNIVWYNQNTSSILKGETLLGKNVNGIIREIDINMVLSRQKSYFEYIKLKDKYYNIFASVVNTSESKNEEDDIILLYFYDVSEIKNILDSQEAIVLIEVDNLDEVVKTTEENNKPLLIAEIERTVNSYAQSLNAMIKKYSTNKYILSVQDKFIQKEIEKKFDILDTVREINLGNKLAVTLSVGVGRRAATPLENHNQANFAKELALGRGGDQVVVKQGENLEFFGGKTKEVEKRTRVRARVIAHALKDLIDESSTVFIMGHRNADIDCLGAAVGLYSVVRNLNRECHIVLDEPTNSIKQILDKFKDEPDYEGVFITSESCKTKINDSSLLILVDVHNKNYVQSQDVVNKIKRVVIIDHHRKSANYIENTILSYMEPYASSTSELVTEILQYIIEKPKVKQLEAEALLAGICVDTKNFFFKTGVRTFEAASFLRRLGADTIDVKKLFTDDLETYIKRSEIIKSAVVEKNVAIAICPAKIEDPVLAAQAADELLNITGIQASFVFVKIEDDVHISGRSLGDVNVQVILEALGGGGHMTMAGARLTNATVAEAIEKLKESVNKYLREGEK